MDKKKNEERLNKNMAAGQFWFFLLIIIVFSSILFFNSNGMAEITGGATLQTISFMKEGSDYFFETKEIKGLQTVKITIAEDVRNSLIKAEEISENEFEDTYEGFAYTLFSIESEDEDKFGEITFSFKIEKEEMQRLGIAKDNLYLYRQKTEIPLTKTKEDETFYFYEAKITGLGEFLLGKVAFPKTEESKDILIEPLEEYGQKEEAGEKVSEEEIKTAVKIEPKRSWWKKILEFLGFR